MFKTRFWNKKHVANIQNTLNFLKFKTRCLCFKRVANIQKQIASVWNALWNIQNALLLFQTGCEYSERVTNIQNMLLISETSSEY